MEGSRVGEPSADCDRFGRTVTPPPVQLGPRNAPVPVPVPEPGQPAEVISGSGSDTGPDIFFGGAALAAWLRRTGPVGLAVAALLGGVVVGGGTGYAVQASRTPALLPAVAPAGTATTSPEPDAAHDTAVRSEGDLRDLLLPVPSGAHRVRNPATADGRMTLAQYAGTLSTQQPRKQLELLGFRRAVVVDWADGEGTTAEIVLVQFRQDTVLNASVWTERVQAAYNAQADTEAAPQPVDGSTDATVYKFRRPDPGADELPYGGVAFATHGDIAVEITMGSSKPVPVATVTSLLKEQVGRL